MLKRISQLLCQKNLPDGHIFGQVQPSVRGGLEYQIEYRSIYFKYLYSNRFQMDIFLGKFNRVSEEGYEKFLTGLNLNYLLRLSKDEVVLVISGEEHDS